MRFGKVIATVLAAGLLMNSLAGCGQAAKTKESSNTETTVQEQRTEEDIVTLKVFSMPSNTSGVKEGWWADILKEKAGVQLEILPSGDEGEQKLQALMASGELPDIVIFKDNKQVVNAVADICCWPMMIIRNCFPIFIRMQITPSAIMLIM